MSQWAKYTRIKKSVNVGEVGKEKLLMIPGAHAQPATTPKKYGIRHLLWMSQGLRNTSPFIKRDLWWMMLIP